MLLWQKKNNLFPFPTDSSGLDRTGSGCLDNDIRTSVCSQGNRFNQWCIEGIKFVPIFCGCLFFIETQRWISSLCCFWLFVEIVVQFVLSFRVWSLLWDMGSGRKTCNMWSWSHDPFSVTAPPQSCSSVFSVSSPQQIRDNKVERSWILNKLSSTQIDSMNWCKKLMRTSKHCSQRHQWWWQWRRNSLWVPSLLFTLDICWMISTISLLVLKVIVKNWKDSMIWMWERTCFPTTINLPFVPLIPFPSFLFSFRSNLFFSLLIFHQEKSRSQLLLELEMLVHVTQHLVSSQAFLSLLSSLKSLEHKKRETDTTEESESVVTILSRWPEEMHEKAVFLWTSMLVAQVSIHGLCFCQPNFFWSSLCVCVFLIWYFICFSRSFLNLWKLLTTPLTLQFTISNWDGKVCVVCQPLFHGGYHRLLPVYIHCINGLVFVSLETQLSLSPVPNKAH